MAHVLNVKHFLISDRNDYRPLTLIRFIDDKAYLRLGASEGFKSIRNTRRILIHLQPRVKYETFQI